RSFPTRRSSEAGVDAFEQRGHLRGIRNIGLQRQGMAALGTDGLGHGFGCFGIAAVVEHHRVAACGGQGRGGRTDAAAGAGDQQYPWLGHACPPGYMRNTPKRAGSIGALSEADRPRPSTRRVSAGSMMPSSHSRAVAYQGLPWCSYCSRTGALKLSSSSALHWPPPASIASRRTMASTLAACSPPITLMRAFGHIHRKRAP